MTEAPYEVSKLREMILQLAIQGKLVSQDPKDEPASIKAAEVAKRKDAFIEQHGYRKVKRLKSVTEDEKLFELPKGWHWNRIGDVLAVIRGASPMPKGDPRYFSEARTQYSWVKISDIGKHSVGKVLYDTDEFLTDQGAGKSVFLPKGTLILTNSATIGVPIFLGIPGCIHDGYLAFPFLPLDYINEIYLYHFFTNLKQYMHAKARGLAQLNLNGLSHLTVEKGVDKLIPRLIMSHIKVDNIIGGHYEHCFHLFKVSHK